LKRESLKINAIRLLIIILLFLITQRSEGAWQVGCDLNAFPEVGNLVLRRPALEYEIFIDHVNRLGGIYRFAVSHIRPEIKSGEKLTSVKLSTFWLLRRDGFNIWKLHTYMSSGLGITRFEKRNDNGIVELGVLSFRADLSVRVWEHRRIEVTAGLTYRGCPLHDSGWVSDRFGVTVAITDRL